MALGCLSELARLEAPWEEPGLQWLRSDESQTAGAAGRLLQTESSPPTPWHGGGHRPHPGEVPTLSDLNGSGLRVAAASLI